MKIMVTKITKIVKLIVMVIMIAILLTKKVAILIMIKRIREYNKVFLVH